MKHVGYAICHLDGSFYTLEGTGDGIKFCPTHFASFTVFHTKELAKEICETLNKAYNLDLKVVPIYTALEDDE